MANQDRHTVLICGSRSIKSYGIVVDAIERAPFDVERVLHGDADGVDTSADVYCRLNSIPVRGISPDYEKFSHDPKRAPLARNKKLVSKSDAVIAIMEDNSSGTSYTIKKAMESGMEIVKTSYKGGDIEVYYLR